MNHRQQGQGLYIPIPGLPGGGGGFPGEDTLAAAIPAADSWIALNVRFKD